MVELALLPTQHIYDGPGTSWDWVRRFGGVSAPTAKLSLLAYVVAFTCMALALRWMTSAHLTLPCLATVKQAACAGTCVQYRRKYLVYCVADGLLHTSLYLRPLTAQLRVWCRFAGVILTLFKQQSPQHDHLSMECYNWLKVQALPTPACSSALCYVRRLCRM
jgi:hypothetical protein